MTKPGILALQGCVDPHISFFNKLGVNCIEIKNSIQLARIDRIILPGGESSTMLKLLKANKLFVDLKNFITDHPTWGICAGAILLAKTVENPTQESFNAINIKATRNFYGSQLNSFKSNLELFGKSVDVDFIRAPKLDPLSKGVEILASLDQQPVLLKSKNIIASSFHTELGNDEIMHDFFLKM
ncbi:MAG: pyridoxal 5'-phosphate synthase glutaminase subunit PdxT [Bdellovibrionales bacterium]|nr:pyridoxal 5'-phosphate synthase glutaminase subunit PdxT [Bdellovibrionales bacterium]